MIQYLELSISEFGAKILGLINGLGHFTAFVMKNMYWLFKPPFRYKLFFEQMYFIGNKSIFIIFLTSIFSGMVFAYQT